jgi:hypothetical protein
LTVAVESFQVELRLAQASAVTVQQMLNASGPRAVADSTF